MIPSVCSGLILNLTFQYRAETQKVYLGIITHKKPGICQDKQQYELVPQRKFPSGM